MSLTAVNDKKKCHCLDVYYDKKQCHLLDVYYDIFSAVPYLYNCTEKSSTPSEIYDIYSQVSHVFLTFKL